MDNDALAETWADCGGGETATPIRLRTDDGSGEVVRPVNDGGLDGDVLDGDRREFGEAVDKAVAYCTETVELSAESSVAYAVDVSGSSTLLTWGL